MQAGVFTSQNRKNNFLLLRSCIWATLEAGFVQEELAGVQSQQTVPMLVLL